MKRLGSFAVALLVALAFAPSARTQNITTFAGGGNTFSGPATSLPAGVPYKVSQKDGAGNYYIASVVTDRILKVNALGEMSLLAGNGTRGYSGDGGPAVEASLALGAGGSTTIGIALDSAGNVYFADGGNEVVRVVNTQTSAITINGVTIQPGNIQTVAGHPCTGTCLYGDGGPATSAVFDSPSGVAVDAAGNIYISDSADLTVRVVNTQPSSSITIFNVTIAAGDIKTIAGNVSLNPCPTFADGAQATAVCLGNSNGLAFDSSGNLYIAAESARIFEVIKTTGALDSVAGTGSAGYSGDGGAATSAEIGEFPGDLAIDSAGNLFIADTENNVIRKVTASTHNISTVAGVDNSGTGVAGYNGDGITATTAELNDPRGVAVDSSDNIFIADTQNYRIREVTNSTGKISTVAGNGWIDYNGDGVLATNTDLLQPSAVAVDGSGNVFIADGNNAIRKVAAGATPTITTVAGNGVYGYSGDGGAGTSASICFPGGVAVGGPGNSVFFSDIDNEVVREVTGGIISTFAGYYPGLPCWGGSTGSLSKTPVTPPTSAYFYNPYGVAVDSAGDVFIADSEHNAVVEVKAGTVSVVAGGNMTGGYGGDGGVATSAELNTPYGVALDGKGNLFIADTGNNRIREVNLTTQIINTVAGDGTAGYIGEGTATSVELNFPEGVAVDSLGDIFIADTYNNRIREVTAGIISTVAGDGSYGYNGDGIPATTAWLGNPTGVAVDSLGNLYIADLGNSRIREVLLATSTSVGSSLNPSTYGQSVTFTATVTAVAPGSGTPTGTVTFLDGGSAIGSGMLSGGVASLAISTLAVGNHTITTSYGGDANYTGSTGSLTGNPQVVSQAQSTTTFTSTPPAQLPFNGTYTPTASTTGDGTLTIGASGACAISGGVVTINAGSGICTVTATTAAGNNYLGSSATPQTITATNATATVMLSNMTQTYTGSPLSPTATTTPGGLTVNFTYNGSSTAPAAAGSYSLVATIAPGGNYAGSASGTFTISKAQSTTTFTSTAPAQLPYNGTYTPTASTTGDGTLTIGASGACAISAGVVTINAGSGICTVTATTAAGNNYLGSSATSQTITAIKAAATVTVGTSGPSTAGMAYTVSVTVNPQFGGTPTGTVNVSDDKGASCPTIMLSGGAGSCSLTSTAAGSRTITAMYSGDANFTGSSGHTSQTVNVGLVTTLMLSPANVSITAGGSQSYTAAGFDAYSNPAGDVTASTTFSIGPNGSCTGTSCTATVADANGSVHTVTGTYTSGGRGSTNLTVTAGSFTLLQLLVPGETAAPGTGDGFTGTPNTQYVNGPFQVTVNAVDQYWNLVNTVTDTVAITSTDPKAIPPADAALAAGTRTFNVTLDTVSYNPATTTLTATDATNDSMTASTSPVIPVIVVYTASISPADAGTGQATNYTITVANNTTTNGNTNSLRSATVAIPANGGTPTSISVAAANGNTSINWMVDSAPPTAYASGYVTVRECTASDAVSPCNGLGGNDVTPGGTIVIQFTATSSATVPEVWTTTGYSDAAYTSTLPLAGPEPTVNFGAAPAITSASSTTFTYNTAGTFTVTTTGALPLSLSESGALPGTAVTFMDNGNGTATLAGTPNAAGNFQLTITADNHYGSDATQNFTLVVNKAQSTTTFSSTPPSQLPFNGTYTPTASTTGDGTLTIGASGACAISGGVVAINASSGTCTVTATTAAGNNYLGSSATPQTITATNANATVTLSNMTPTYNGTPLSPTVTTSPSGLSYTLTGAPDTNAGSYSVTATITAANYSGSAGGMFIINKAQSTTTFNSTPPAQLPFNGTYFPTASTTGDGTLTIGASGACAISGGVVTINAGSGTCTVTATTAAGNNYLGSSATPQTITATNATAMVTLSNMTQTYTGSPLSPTVTTSPSGLSYTLTGAQDTNAGSYSVTATITAANYSGSASGTFVIQQASQSITFGSIPAQVVGNKVSLSASATSGLAVSFASTTLSVCSVSGTTATMLEAGTCTIQATQAGNANYLAATPVSVSFTVTAGATFKLIATPSSETVHRGTLAAFLLEAQSVNSFSGNVKVTCSGGPANSVCGEFPQTLNLQPNKTAIAISGVLFPKNTTLGTYTITFTGTSGSLVVSTSAQFNVEN
jgi:hypothetical protein